MRSLTLIRTGSEVAAPPSSTEIGEIVCKVEDGAKEPLGRQLFREAWSQRLANPRSALVIGVAAAEVGLKALIGTLIPAASWLAEEIQTPPLRKMLRDFLPSLPIRAKRSDGATISLPRELIRQVDKAAEHRNKVVHRGAPPPGRQELINMLEAISDLLWMCDVYSGSFGLSSTLHWKQG